MTLKNKFLSFVELQRCANEAKLAYGTQSPVTYESYQKANLAKRELMNMLEAIDNGTDVHITAKQEEAAQKARLA